MLMRWNAMEPAAGEGGRRQLGVARTLLELWHHKEPEIGTAPGANFVLCQCNGTTAEYRPAKLSVSGIWHAGISDIFAQPGVMID